MIDFLSSMLGTTLIEWIAVGCGLLNVGLLIRRSLWNYPFGFVMVILYFFIFWEYRLYSDAVLQIYFFVIQIYGVWMWLHGRASDGRVTVVPLSRSAFGLYLGITTIAWIGIGWAMRTYTDAAAPFWDAAVAALSVTAQLLMSRRHVESWILWIAVDILAIGLFVSRGLEPTAALYAVFLVMAAAGLYRWRRAPRSAFAHA